MDSTYKSTKPQTKQTSLTNYTEMDSSSPDQIIKEIPRVIRIYKDGRCQKLTGTDTVPAGVDPSSGVQSKDVVILPETRLSVRLYIPKPQNSTVRKLPLLIYFHGGGFVTESAASPLYHKFLNLIAAESGVVIVSVDYRTAPEHPVPVCFNDSWEAIKWVAQHVDGNGPEPWLNELADLGKVFFVGDSAGANIAHHMAIRVGSENPTQNVIRVGSSGPCPSVTLQGVILLHPYFWGNDRVGSESNDNPRTALVGEIWKIAYPGTSGLDDPLINPAMDSKVSDLGCSKVFVFVAEKDLLKDRGYYYKDILGKVGWNGDIEIIEDKGVDHVYFLFNPSLDSACILRKRICTIINGQD